MARPRAPRWIRIRSPRVIATERRAHVREVRAYARGHKTLTTASPKNLALYGRIFPPAIAAREMRRRTPYHDNRVNDQYASVFRGRMVKRKTGAFWGFPAGRRVTRTVRAR